MFWDSVRKWTAVLEREMTLARLPSRRKPIRLAVEALEDRLVPSLVDGGFETPSLGTGYQYDPAGAAWSFAGNAGLTGNNNGFTNGNPAAPGGTQVAFLQTSGALEQSVTLA